MINYLWSKELSLEAEVGTKFMDTSLAGVKSNTKDLFATLGIRRDFNLDGLSKCHGMVVSCAWARPAAMQQGVGPNGAPVLPQKAVPPAIAAFAIEGGLRYWFSSAKNRYNYFADTTSDMLVSRLSYVGLTGHTGEAFFRIDAHEGPLANAFVKGYIGGGGITSGKLYDEDFVPFIDPYSKTSSDANGRLQYASIDLGYNVFEVERFRFGAFVGYHHWLETVDARGCSQVGGNPFICAPALVSNCEGDYRARSLEYAPRRSSVAGANVTDRLSWQSEFAYVWTVQHALDTHYFTFGSDPAAGHGTGFQAETLLKYQITDSFSMGIGGRWWHFNTQAVDSFNQLLQYTTDRYGVFLQGDLQIQLERFRAKWIMFA